MYNSGYQTKLVLALVGIIIGLTALIFVLIATRTTPTPVATNVPPAPYAAEVVQAPVACNAIFEALGGCK